MPIILDPITGPPPTPAPPGTPSSPSLAQIEVALARRVGPFHYLTADPLHDRHLRPRAHGLQRRRQQWPPDTGPAVAGLAVPIRAIRGPPPAPGSGAAAGGASRLATLLL